MNQNLCVYEDQEKLKIMIQIGLKLDKMDKEQLAKLLKWVEDNLR